MDDPSLTTSFLPKVKLAYYFTIVRASDSSSRLDYVRVISTPIIIIIIIVRDKTVLLVVISVALNN